MALPVSGAISFNAINVELGVAGTTQASLNQASYRTLAGVPSGAISMSDFYGKANQFSFTISSNQTNANLRTLALNAGWNGTTKVAATIASGVFCSSNSTGTPGLTVNGSFPGGVELINNGFIVGMGGAGGRGTDGVSGGANGTNGSVGGLALSVSSAITINNAGTIGGGGGGGAGGRGILDSKNSPTASGGGGGGGGGKSGAAANSSGGGGGGTDPAMVARANGAAGGAGNTSNGGTGGAGGNTPRSPALIAPNGGNGGAYGASGNSETINTNNNLEGPVRSPGGGGGAISGNSNITYIATGTRLGAIT
jgi:hypothetical protein